MSKRHWTGGGPHRQPVEPEAKPVVKKTETKTATKKDESAE